MGSPKGRSRSSSVSTASLSARRSEPTGWPSPPSPGPRSPRAGVPVFLMDGAEVPIDSTTTAADGTYAFSILHPGDTYKIGFAAPSNSIRSPADQGADDARDSDAD